MNFNLDLKIDFSSVGDEVRQTFASKNLVNHHAMWLGMAVSVRRALICTGVNYPASGQERNF